MKSGRWPLIRGARYLEVAAVFVCHSLFVVLCLPFFVCRSLFAVLCLSFFVCRSFSFSTEGKNNACDEGSIEILAGLLTDDDTNVRAHVCAALMA